MISVPQLGRLSGLFKRRKKQGKKERKKEKKANRNPDPSATAGDRSIDLVLTIVI